MIFNVAQISGTGFSSSITTFAFFLTLLSMNGAVNTWNVREYAPKEQVPEFIYERNHSREKITAWAGLCGNGTLLGPYIFDGNVNGYYYLKMINNFTFPQLQEHFNNQFDGVFQYLWWFQDRAPAHRLKVVRHKLHEMFANRVVIFYHEVEWPPRSFDMTHCDFFLWGYMKLQVFVTLLRDMQNLLNRI